MAVKDGRLARNVDNGVNLPRVGKHEHRYLTHEQVDDLATAAGYPADPSKHSSLDTRTNETYRLVVLLLAYTGVRFGEDGCAPRRPARPAPQPPSSSSP